MAVKLNKKVGLTVGIIVLVIAAAVIWWLTKPASAPDGGLNKVSEDVEAGVQLTDADIANLDKTEAFYNTLATAAIQNKVTTVRDYTDYIDKAKTEVNFRNVNQGSFDFESKDLTFAQDLLNAKTGKVSSMTRCENGKFYDYFSFSKSWKEDTAPSKPCEFSTSPRVQTNIGDRFSANGLTIDQAAKYVNYLKDKEAFKVESLALADHNQNQYLKFEVTLMPKPESVGGINVDIGLQYMLFAVRDGAGVDVAELPFGYIGDPAGGVKLTWYVDPATKLPAYGEFDSYEPNSSEQVANSYRYNVAYSFGEFQEVGKSEKSLALNW